MAEYISKEAVIAEIKRRLWLLVPKMTFQQQRVELEKLLSFIDTLEVKEVDLEREVNAYMVNEMKFLSDEVGYDTLSTIAKHFFELGLKAQKGE